MRVSYDWTEADWNEAVTLATEKPRRRGSVPGMVYALIGIPLIGAVMDAMRSVRGTGKLTGAGIAVPVLLVALAAVLGAGMLVAHLQRRRRVRTQLPMPLGQWEAVVLEAGWQFHEKQSNTGVLPAVHATQDSSANAATAAAENQEDSEPVTPAPPVSGEAVPVTGIAEVKSAPAANQPATAEIPAGPEASSTLPSSVVHVASADDPAKAVQPETETGACAEPTPQPDAAMRPENVPAPPAKPATTLAPWKDLTGSRVSDHVIVLLHPAGFHAVPIRCMTADQASHLHRMVIRKLRPSPAAL